jgi:hypothetical protein
MKAVNCHPIRPRFSLCFAALALLALCAFESSQAQVVTLVDNNSVAQINVGSQQGMFYWAVLNQPNQFQNQLHQQWFWYRVGAGPESSIDTIGAPLISGLTSSTVTTTYYDSLNRFNIGVTYSLLGGGPTSGTADITEQIAINNTSGAGLDFHFFQYSDFDIGGTPAGDTVLLSQNPFTGRINQADQFAGSSLVEVVNTPNANHGEAAFVPATLVKLNDAAPTVLNDNLGPVGPGDVSWALQWDTTIGVGGSLLISKDKQLTVEFVPEPSTFALVSVGLIACGFLRRRQAV